MKLFAVKINETIGSFAPIELLPVTIKEMKDLTKLNTEVLEEETRKEHTELLKHLETAEILIAEVTNFVSAPVSKYFEQSGEENA